MESFTSSMHFDRLEGFTYNHMAHISHRSCSHVKASMVVTIHLCRDPVSLFLLDYIRSFLHIISRPIVLV